MKRKKPPVVLASILVVMAGAAILFIPKNEDPMQPPPEQKKSAEPTGQSRKTPSKSAVAKQAAVVDTVNPDGSPSAAPDGPAGANPATATIYLPRIKPMKQQPNDSSVQAQWYRSGARAANKDGFK